MKTHVRKSSFKPIMIAVFFSASLVFSQSVISQSCQKETKAKKESAEVMQKKMYQSAAEGNLEALKFLIEEKGVDVNTILKDGQTALHIMAT